jgi:hypothetical protein
VFLWLGVAFIVFGSIAVAIGKRSRMIQWRERSRTQIANRTTLQRPSTFTISSNYHQRNFGQHNNVCANTDNSNYFGIADR